MSDGRNPGPSPGLSADVARRWDALLRLFWHPVCRVDDVGPSGVTAARVLATDLAVARLGERRWAAYADRCPHRSARLSVGTAEPDGLRCAYHGWRFDDRGRCDDIPSLPGSPIPSAACTPTHRATEAYGFVWVLLDDRLDPPIPSCPMVDGGAADAGELRVLRPDPYTWPVGAPRRVENFVDLAHFAFVHDGSLGRRDAPVPPLPDIERADGALAFRYDPPELEADPSAMFGSSVYLMPMPLTVNIDFHMSGGVRRILWMTACPVELGVTRAFWMMGRNDELDPSFDADHLAFQAQVLAEDEPVVCNQVPPELDLTPGLELSVKTDKVSIAYRRWLGELLATIGPDGRIDDAALDALRTAVRPAAPATLAGG